MSATAMGFVWRGSSRAGGLSLRPLFCPKSNSCSTCRTSGRARLGATLSPSRAILCGWPRPGLTLIGSFLRDGRQTMEREQKDLGSSSHRPHTFPSGRVPSRSVLTDHELPVMLRLNLAIDIRLRQGSGEGAGALLASNLRLRKRV
jgi:hypothetical protein